MSERVSTPRFASGRSTPLLRVGSDATISDLPRASGHSELRIGGRITAVLAWCRRHVKDAAFGLLPAVAALVAAGAVLELWHGSLRIPYAYSSDALFVEAVTKNLAHGWYYTNAQLAAPFGQQLFDFPIGNALNLAILKLLVVAFGNPIAAVNVFFLLTFPLTALASYIVMRRVNVSRGVAAACSVLFALLPYHFRRGEAHAFLSAYYVVPLIAYLMLGVFGSFHLFDTAGEPVSRWRRRATRRNLATFGVCLLIGASSPYYALAAAILLVIAAAITGIASHSIREALKTLVLAGIVVATFAATAAPAISYRLHHGPNELAGKRSAFETELYGLKVTDLVLPLDDHRLKPLAHMKEEYDSTSPVTSEGGQTLGFIGTIGLLALLGGGFITVVRGSWRVGGAAFLHACAATVIVLLFATTAGFSSVLSYTLTPQLHAWNRLSVLVGFFSLLAVGFLLDRLRRRLRATAFSFVFPIVLVVVVTLGVLDQTSSAFVPPYKEIHRSFVSDARFVQTIERRLPSGAAIYQLPYVPFPESEVPGPNDYVELKEYLHSQSLRWSYGAMKGRTSDWNATLSALPLRLVLPVVAASGFEGLTIDRSSYSDNGQAAKTQVEHRLRLRPLVSADGRLLFYDLRPLRSWLESHYSSAEIGRLRTAALHPVTIEWTGSFWDEERNGVNAWRWSKSREAYFGVDNPTSESRRLTLRFVLAAQQSGQSNAIVFYPDQSTEMIRVSPTGVLVERTLTLPPGHHFVRISSDASKIPTVPGDPRSALYVRVANASLIDTAFAILDRSARARPSSAGSSRIRSLGLPAHGGTPHIKGAQSGRAIRVR